MRISKFGNKFTQHSGITQLMDDLNDGLRNPDTVMLGGGNPATIPEMQKHFEQIAKTLLDDGRLITSMSNYDGPQGKNEFIDALASLFKTHFGWEISSKNIMLTNGSQSAFFYLFNLFAGEYADGSTKKILLPLAPEYIGYGDAGISPDMFISYKPDISPLTDGQFKYHIDFDAITVDDSIGAICASRPTNPTGNVLTDEEICNLDQLAQAHQIPLIIDNAYGVPFPNIIFEDVKPFWNSNTILCSSLSKLGLPGLRCGIIIAEEKIITALSNLNGIISLSPGSLGPAVGLELVKSGQILSLSETVIKPFYREKAQLSLTLLRKSITDTRFKIHKPEGAMFLWLWFEGLPITTKELYQRLKKKGLLIVPGEYFFFGLEEQWKHSEECIRMNYVQDEETMRKGIAILADEVNKAYLE
ncbi:valine--pyruvate transaminase [Veronia pacifica]|uniref:Valine--pyruvate transaminase n=1 Tax=Veronia pacifica TaxID=1080227 RepID=A0A1C3EFP3_9GAMM|nr:valine--pyruvate transaminase [Veronia pacifica]ODA32040.1 valine--pyruvate transaminase [Veronia pacifica]